MELNISRPRRFTVVIVAIGLQENGSITYFHAAVTPVLVAPGRPQIISLEPEFITPQDGHDFLRLRERCCNRVGLLPIPASHKTRL